MINSYPKSIEACAAHYGESGDAMRNYLTEGHKRAELLSNRGPLVFNADGSLDKKIHAAYSKYGFYIFEGVFSQSELDELEQDVNEMRKQFPTGPDSKLNAAGEPGLGVDCKAPTLQWVKPLSDPLGGSTRFNGRHQVKLFEPKAADDAPEFLPLVLMGNLQFSEACLRAYGHPDLLRLCAAVNGEDFTPFHDIIFFKDPGLGAAVSWHQDGDTHWDTPQYDENSHGFNLMLQLYGSTAVNGVWVVPGSHKEGRLDIKEMVAKAGSERLPDAVPLLCNPGDMVICNRQLVHGSFANTGFEPRVTLNFGCHPLSSVLNVQGAGMHSEAAVYTEDFIRERSKVIGLAIAARKKHFPNEQPYEYKPLAGMTFDWDAEGLQSLKDYNLRDLSI